MFQSITLRFSETGDLVLPLKGITVFVGPNNSGKSLALREFENSTNVHPFPADNKIVVDYEVEWPTEAELNATLEKSKVYSYPGLALNQVSLGRFNPGGGLEQATHDINGLRSIISSKSDKRWLGTQYLKWGVIRLDGRSRFNLTNDMHGGDLLGTPQNVLQGLFSNEKTRSEVRSKIKDAFGSYFVIDPTNLGQLRIRLSTTEPLDDEQSLNLVARDFHAKAQHIKEASDGVQAYVGIITAVLSGEYHTIIIDEPEAFLHPPLARKLGKHLSSLAAKNGGSLVVSTHSADFLMGCLQSGVPVKVVRLEYKDGKSRAKTVDSSALETLFRNPLMRSANVIAGLFYDGIVVTESDNDRSFYSEIYHRLMEEDDTLPSILFVNAQNKQTTREIIGPMRNFGVPAAAICDVDIFKDGGKTWTDWLASANLPTASHAGLGMQRSSVNEAFKNSGKNMKTEGGVELLQASDKSAATLLLDNLDNFGLFVVRGGEVEDWLKHLGVPGKKTDWAIAMLERLGGDPNDSSYVTPSSGDVWSFLKKVAVWVRDPARNGMI